eukprot:1270106-Amphidinium_carterae.2
MFGIAVRWSAPLSRGLMHPLDPSLCAAFRCCSVLHGTAVSQHCAPPFCGSLLAGSLHFIEVDPNAA